MNWPFSRRLPSLKADADATDPEDEELMGRLPDVVRMWVLITRCGLREPFPTHWCGWFRIPTSGTEDLEALLKGCMPPSDDILCRRLDLD